MGNELLNSRHETQPSLDGIGSKEKEARLGVDESLARDLDALLKSAGCSVTFENRLLKIKNNSNRTLFTLDDTFSAKKIGNTYVMENTVGTKIEIGGGNDRYTMNGNSYRISFDNTLTDQYQVLPEYGTTFAVKVGGSNGKQLELKYIFSGVEAETIQDKTNPTKKVLAGKDVDGKRLTLQQITIGYTPEYRKVIENAGYKVLEGGNIESKDGSPIDIGGGSKNSHIDLAGRKDVIYGVEIQGGSLIIKGKRDSITISVR